MSIVSQAESSPLFFRRDPTRAGDPAPARGSVAFWVLGLVLTAYVGACTGNRDNRLDADAWEHHRVVKALAAQLWKPGNPTYDSAIPSVRYSPYTIALAILCRTTGLDAYAALSGAAVVNTGLLVCGVWLLLASFHEQRAAAAVLVVMVSLWGAAPGYANSYALADLPWHQVNPSAFSFALVLVSWSFVRKMATGGFRWLRASAVVVLNTTAMLDHPMTGSLGLMGLFVIAIASPGNHPPGNHSPVGRPTWDRRRMLAVMAIFSTLVVLLCTMWPWYSFVAALRSRHDLDFWFNPSILRLLLTVWVAPVILGATFALPFRDRPLVRVCLLGFAATLLAGLVSLPTRSPVLARFPLPGAVFGHIAVGIFAHQSGVFRLSTWPARLRAITEGMPRAAYPLLQCTLTAMLGYTLLPQMIDVATAPHLARSYVARVRRLRDQQIHPRPLFSDLLTPVGAHDTVLSDLDTSWVIPSFNGRIVAALHYELFVPDQHARAKAVQKSFAPNTTEVELDEILKRYDVKWILLDRAKVNADVYHALVLRFHRRGESAG